MPVTKISEDGETTKYDWTLDTDGYPIKLIKSSIDREMLTLPFSTGNNSSISHKENTLYFYEILFL